MNAWPTVGVAGLGRMGRPIAANILAAGFPLVVWNRTPEKADDLLARGASLVESPRGLTEQAEIVLTSLADPAAVEAVYFGRDGLLDEVRAGTVLVVIDADAGSTYRVTLFPRDEVVVGV